MFELTSCSQTLASIYTNWNLETAYLSSVGWSVEDHSKFSTTYLELYRAKLNELKIKYDLMYETKEEINQTGDGDTYFNLYLYCEEYSVCIWINTETSFANYRVNLYYYGKDGVIGEYEEYSNVVEFVNDFTNYVAYDTKTDENYFELLLDEAYSTQSGQAQYTYHSDDIIGSVGYTVNTNYSYGNYYYMARMNTNDRIPSNSFQFKGLLKPLS